MRFHPRRVATCVLTGLCVVICIRLVYVTENIPSYTGHQLGAKPQILIYQDYANPLNRQLHDILINPDEIIPNKSALEVNPHPNPGEKLSDKLLRRIQIKDVSPELGSKVRKRRRKHRKIKKNSTPKIYHSDPSLVWPNIDNQWNDRIVAQLNYVPPLAKKRRGGDLLKTIMVFSGIGANTPPGQQKFLDDKCPVNTCYLTDELAWVDNANAVVFHYDLGGDQWIRPEKQIWILFMLESPMNTISVKNFNNRINWTSTYRSDSTVVAPYEKFVHFANFTQLPAKPQKDYASSKSRMIAWFVSNCGARNKRMDFVHELRRYVQLDIYGACGNMTCSRLEEQECFEMLKSDYKFYLSFENSNCQYYISEKFYSNALWNDVVPIVMGGRREDYRAVAPPHSYIHVEDFDTPRELANYLNKLDKNDDLYNQYFRWKETGEFINTKKKKVPTATLR